MPARLLLNAQVVRTFSPRRTRSQPPRVRLGELSAQQIDAVREAMVRARAADSAGDKGAREQALVDAERALKP